MTKKKPVKKTVKSKQSKKNEKSDSLLKSWRDFNPSVPFSFFAAAREAAKEKNS